MLNGVVRRPAIEDLDLVHNLVEQCLQLHLSKRDAANLIFREANIDPGYTELVWEQLEQENPEFFDCYYVRLALKQQIELFNELLRQQAALTQEITNGVAPSPGSNGSHVSGNGSHISGNGSHISGNGSGTLGNGYHISDRSHRPVNGCHGPENGAHMPENGSHRPVNGSHRPENGSHRPENGSHRPINGSYRTENISHRPINGSHGPISGSYMEHLAQNGGCYRTDEAGPSTRTTNLQPAMSSNVASAFTCGMSVLPMPTPFDVSNPSRGIDFLPKYNTLHVHSSNSTELIQGLNAEIIKPGSDYSDSQAIFQTYADVVGTRASVEGAPFSCVEASSQILNESLLAMNGFSFGHFGQIPENFRVSDLSTAYPSENENYANSSFGTTIAGSFFVSQDVVEVPEDTSGGISESYNS